MGELIVKMKRKKAKNTECPEVESTKSRNNSKSLFVRAEMRMHSELLRFKAYNLFKKHSRDLLSEFHPNLQSSELTFFHFPVDDN